MKELLFGFANLFCLLLILFLSIRKKAPKAIERRSRAIAKEIELAGEEERMARLGLEEYKAKVKNYDEMQAILSKQAENEISAFKKVVGKDTSDFSKRIQLMTARAVRLEEDQVLYVLHEGMVNQAVSNVGQQLKTVLADADHRRIIADGLQELERITYGQVKST